MCDPTLKTAATKLAEETPQHLGQPTTPPIKWRREGSDLLVILADGRVIYGPYKPASIERDSIPPKTHTRPTRTGLPSRKQSGLPAQAGNPHSSLAKHKSR